MSFESCYQELMTPSNKLFYLRLSIARKPELNWGEAQIILNGINAILAEQKASLSQHYKSLLKRMTPFNVTKPELKDTIDKGLSDYQGTKQIDFSKLSNQHYLSPNRRTPITTTKSCSTG